MKIAVHAPPPGSHTGVADYAEALLPALRRFGAVEPDAETADLHLYHVGNNGLHAEIYAAALRLPGVVVLHDAVLQHFLLGSLTQAQYVDEFVLNYGEWLRQTGEELWRDRAMSGVDPRYFRFPMLKRLVAASKAVIVHNPGAAGLAQAHGAADVSVIPHFFEKPAWDFNPSEIAAFRERLGAGRATTVFGIFGYLRETKRVIPCLASFLRLAAVRSDVALLLAGEAVSADLARLLEAEASHPAIHRMGHLSDRELDLALSSVDCGLNLRYPGAGESSGIAIRLMGRAKPVIVSDIPENEDFPEDILLRVSPGASELDELFSQMGLATEFPELIKQIGLRAASHIRVHHAPDSVARQYWETLERAAKLT